MEELQILQGELLVLKRDLEKIESEKKEIKEAAHRLENLLLPYGISLSSQSLKQEEINSKIAFLTSRGENLRKRLVKFVNEIYKIKNKGLFKVGEDDSYINDLEEAINIAEQLNTQVEQLIEKAKLLRG